MKSLSVLVDDQLDAALESVSADKGRAKADLVIQVLRRYVQTERLRQSLEAPELAALYQELEAEDVQLAEDGMEEYRRLLAEADCF